jgi:oleate hydratase
LHEQHHIVRGGIAGLATAVFLIRDVGADAKNIRICEQLGLAGGSRDGGGDREAGHLTRGGRMFEEHFACTFDLLRSIPSADDPAISLADDIMAFNKMAPGSSNCRLMRNGKPAEDRFDLTLCARDICDINRLMLQSKSALGARTIENWFKPGFFNRNFWLMWATMFSFQPWRSLIEMQRCLPRFIHLFPGFTRIAGILRTRCNQYVSTGAPTLAWLNDRGVSVRTGAQIVGVTIAGPSHDRSVSALRLADGTDGTDVPIAEANRVCLTFGSMTDGSVLGSNDRASALDDREGGAWTLWRRLAAQNEGFGRPEAFCGDTGKTAWNSFTVTMDGPDFIELLADVSDKRAGTGGVITFAESGWRLSFVTAHQPDFGGKNTGLARAGAMACVVSALVNSSRNPCGRRPGMRSSKN